MHAGRADAHGLHAEPGSCGATRPGSAGRLPVEWSGVQPAGNASETISKRWAVVFKARGPTSALLCGNAPSSSLRGMTRKENWAISRSGLAIQCGRREAPPATTVAPVTPRRLPALQQLQRQPVPFRRRPCGVSKPSSPEPRLCVREHRWPVQQHVGQPPSSRPPAS
jgi:hypothetical protein